VFAFVTVLITLGGYLINDYFDIETDKINDKSRLSPKSLLLLYFVILFLGFILAFALALSLGQPALSLIYLIAVALLYMYSAKWKRQVLIGNVIVSLFTAAVPLILLYAERDQLDMLNVTSIESTTSSIVFFSAFTFLISMVREIIKDIEDLEGDSAAGYKTLPIVYGIERAKTIAGFYGFVLMGTLLLWQLYSLRFTSDNLLTHLFVFIFLYAPVIFLVVKLLGKSAHWTSLSQLCKAIMLFGLLLIIIIKCNYN
jgi:4-hydroxybenzoate polyprenyltransferase